MFLPIFIALVAHLVPIAMAAPKLVYDLMDQQPPVARVGQEFIFDLLPGTFTSSTTNITYSTSALPSWLAWNPPSLAFYGTPSASDLGQQKITLTADDGSEITSASFNLIVSNYSVPGVHQAFTTQIGNPKSRVFSSATALPGGTGVSIPAGWSFSLGFSYDTFRLSRTEPINGDLYFMARVRGGVGLPSWLNFNNRTMTFDGNAPANGSYTVVVTGTDYWGYQGAQTSFVIEVGQGDAIEAQKGADLNAITTMSRNEVNYKVDISHILYNGKAASANQLALSMDNSEVPWLSLDSSSLTISGMTPDSYLQGTVSPSSLPITFSPSSANSTLGLTTWIPFSAAPYFFLSTNLPAATVAQGKALSFDLKPHLNSANNGVTVNATVSPKDAADWLVFYEDDMTLSGTAPNDASYNQISVLFAATQKSFTATSLLSVGINGASPQSSNNTHTGNSTTNANGTDANGNTQNSNNGKGNSDTGANVDSGNDSAPVPNASNGSTSENGFSHHGLSTAAKIGIAVALGVVGLLILAFILFSCCRRRRKQAKKDKTAGDDDNESFTVGSPNTEYPQSAKIGSPRNFLGDVARLSGFGGFAMRNNASPDNEKNMHPGDDKPTRLGGLGGIFAYNGEKEANAATMATPHLNHSDTSFMGDGDVIGVADPVERSPGRASSFTMSVASSLASWESQGSYQWSEEDGTPQLVAGNRVSNASSIPRPREDFTPRYPRNRSPTTLAKLASQHTVGSHDASEIGQDSQSYSGENHSLGTFSSSSLSGLEPVSRLGRNDSSFRSIEEEDEDALSVEGPAVVAMAERQSFETRAPTERHIPKLRPSKEHITTRGEQPPTKLSRRALAESEEGMFDDAEEAKRRSMVEAERNMSGLGYPAAAIYFGRPESDVYSRSSYTPSEQPATVKQVQGNDGPLSPPMPHVGALNRHRHRPSEPGVLGDGRVLACANETFSIHPQIHPPPSVQLSSATWSSNPPSTYRAEREGGGQLPGWLHFDARELELWGVPSLRNVGDIIEVKIVEKMPRDKKITNPMAFGYGPPPERDVGRLTIEVIDRINSPNTPSQSSPHAL